MVSYLYSLAMSISGCFSLWCPLRVFCVITFGSSKLLLMTLDDTNLFIVLIALSACTALKATTIFKRFKSTISQITDLEWIDSVVQLTKCAKSKGSSNQEVLHLPRMRLINQGLFECTIQLNKNHLVKLYPLPLPSPL